MVRLQLDERHWQKVKAAPSTLWACRARVPGTRHKPRPTSQKYADGDLRTIGHGHGHGHVYGETSNSGTRASTTQSLFSFHPRRSVFHSGA
jgi:hypothetical protein